MKSSIFNEKKEIITIKCFEDLAKLPDRTIELLFNNSNYIEIIYLHVLLRLDMYLENNRCSYAKRKKYFNICFGIIPKLVKHQKNFLSGKKFISDKAFDNIPQRIRAFHRSCLEYNCSFFSGMLATTGNLDKSIFPKERCKLMKHNCVSIIKILAEI